MTNTFHSILFYSLVWELVSVNASWRVNFPTTNEISTDTRYWVRKTWKSRCHYIKLMKKYIKENFEVELCSVIAHQRFRKIVKATCLPAKVEGINNNVGFPAIFFVRGLTHRQLTRTVFIFFWETIVLLVTYSKFKKKCFLCQATESKQQVDICYFNLP